MCNKKVSLNLYLPGILVKRIFCSPCNKSHVRLCFKRAELLLGTVCLKYVKLSGNVSLITVAAHLEIGKIYTFYVYLHVDFSKTFIKVSWEINLNDAFII